MPTSFAPPERHGDEPSIVPSAVQRDAAQNFQSQLSAQIQLYKVSLERNGSLDANLFRGSPIAGRERREDDIGQRLSSFLNGESASFEGRNPQTAQWLERNAERLQQNGIIVRLERNADNALTGNYSILNQGYIPALLTTGQRLDLKHALAEAERELNTGNAERAYELSRPVLKFFDVARLLEVSANIPQQLEFLQQTARQAHTDILSQRYQRANEQLDAIFNFLIVNATLSALPQNFSPELAQQLQRHRDSAFEFMQRGDFTRAATILALVDERLKREGEVAQARQTLDSVSRVGTVLEVRNIPVFQENGQFNERKFQELTGISYADYANGRANGEKGLGLLVAERLRTAISYLQVSSQNIDRSLREFSGGRDGSEALQDSRNSYANAQRDLSLANGMMGALATVMQTREQDRQLAAMTFMQGENAILGYGAREEILRERNAARRILGEMAETARSAFLQIATGNTEEGQRLLGQRLQQTTQRFQAQVGRMNSFFAAAKSYEAMLVNTSDYAERTVTDALQAIETAGYEMNLLDRSEIIRDIGRRVERIRGLLGQLNANNPAQRALAEMAAPFSEAFVKLLQDRDRLFELRQQLLDNYRPSQISGGSGEMLHNQIIISDASVQSMWREYSQLHNGDVTLAHRMLERTQEMPEQLANLQDAFDRMRFGIIGRERQAERIAEDIRIRRYEAIAAGTLVGVAVTAATFGVGTGAGVATGSAVGTSMMVGLGIAGGVMSGMGAYSTYFQWKVAEETGAPQSVIAERRREFVSTLAMSGLMAVAGYAGAGLRAVEAGRATALFTSVGKDMLTAIDLSMLGALSVDGGYQTYVAASEGRYGAAAFTGAMTLLPFAFQGIAALRERSATRARAPAPSERLAVIPEAVIARTVQEVEAAVQGAGREVAAEASAVRTAQRATEAIADSNAESLVGVDAIAAVQAGFTTAEQVGLHNGQLFGQIEEVLSIRARSGEQLQMLVVAGDKSGLSALNRVLGTAVGDQSLAVYHDIVERAVRDVAGDQAVPFFVRAGERSDEIAVVLVGRDLTAVRERLPEAIVRARSEIDLRRYFVGVDSSGRQLTLADAVPNLRHPELATAFSFHPSELISLSPENTSGAISRLLVHAQESGTPWLQETRRMLGVSRSDAGLVPRENLVPIGREVRNEAHVTIASAERVSGLAVRVEAAVDLGAQERLAELVFPLARKAQYEFERGAGTLKFLNTVIGNGPADFVVNTMRSAVSEYAGARNLMIREADALTFVIERGTQRNVEELQEVINNAMIRADIRGLRADLAMSVPVSNATVYDIDAAMMGRRIGVQNFTHQDMTVANLLVSAIANGDESMISRLLGQNHGLDDLVALGRRIPVRNPNIADFATFVSRELGIESGIALNRFFDYAQAHGTEILANRRAIISGAVRAAEAVQAAEVARPAAQVRRISAMEEALQGLRIGTEEELGIRVERGGVVVGTHGRDAFRGLAHAELKERLIEQHSQYLRDFSRGHEIIVGPEINAVLQLRRVNPVLTLDAAIERVADAILPRGRPVEFQFRSGNPAGSRQLEANLPARIDDRTALVRRAARELEYYSSLSERRAAEIPEIYRGAVSIIRENTQRGANRVNVTIELATRMIDTSGIVPIGPIVELERTTGNIARSSAFEGSLPRAVDQRATRRIARVIDALADAPIHLSDIPEEYRSSVLRARLAAPQQRVALIAENAQRMAEQRAAAHTAAVEEVRVPRRVQPQPPPPPQPQRRVEAREAAAPATQAATRIEPSPRAGFDGRTTRLVELAEGRVTRGASYGERIALEDLQQNREYLAARAAGNRNQQLAIAQRYSVRVEYLDRIAESVIAPPQQVEAEYARLLTGRNERLLTPDQIAQLRATARENVITRRTETTAGIAQWEAQFTGRRVSEGREVFILGHGSEAIELTRTQANDAIYYAAFGKQILAQENAAEQQIFVRLGINALPAEQQAQIRELAGMEHFKALALGYQQGIREGRYTATEALAGIAQEANRYPPEIVMHSSNLVAARAEARAVSRAALERLPIAQRNVIESMLDDSVFREAVRSGQNNEYLLMAGARAARFAETGERVMQGATAAHAATPEVQAPAEATETAQLSRRQMLEQRFLERNPFNEQETIERLALWSQHQGASRERVDVTFIIARLRTESREVQERVIRAVGQRVRQAAAEGRATAQDVELAEPFLRTLVREQGPRSARYKPVDELATQHEVPSYREERGDHFPRDLMRQRDHVLDRTLNRGLIATGIEEEKGGVRALVNIMVEGELDSPYIGELSAGETSMTAGNHGPYYVVVDPAAARRLDVGEPLREAAHIAYIVPDNSDVEIIRLGLSRAVERGMLTREEAVNLFSKVITYEDFVSTLRHANLPADAQRETVESLLSTRAAMQRDASARRLFGQVPQGGAAEVRATTVDFSGVNLAPERLNYVRSHFEQLPIDAAAFDNALIIQGDRSGPRANVFDNFQQVLNKESMGGNASAGRAAVNGRYDPQTGRIIAFGNIQHLPEEIRNSGRYFTLIVDIRTQTIVRVMYTEDARITSLVGMQVGETYATVASRLGPGPAASSTLEQQFEHLAGISVQMAQTGERLTPWRMVSGEQRMQYADQLFELYQKSYSRYGLSYNNARELLERLPIWYISTDASGRVNAFAVFSETPYGIRLGLAGALPSSAEGRAAAVSLIREFAHMQGWYGAVSGRPAAIALASGTNVVPFDNAQRVMGRARGARFASAQRDMDNVARMDGFATSPVVIEAAQRAGRAPTELGFDDLVEQAVRNREIPDTPEARANCYAIVQYIDEGPRIVIKMMVGNPAVQQR